MTVNTGVDGTLALELTSAGAAAIFDTVGNPLSGTFPFTSSTYTIDKTPPNVVPPIDLTDSNPSNAAALHFTVHFSENVNGITTADFAPVTTGSISGAAISAVSGNGTSTIIVTVSTGTGDGTLALGIPSAGTIKDTAGNSLAGTPITSSAYTIDKPPVVSSITLVNSSPTNSATVQYTVTFSKPVTGVDEATFGNFVLAPTPAIGGVTGAAITGITGSGTTYTVTVNTGSGDGMLALELANPGAIMDAENQTLVGTPFVSPAYVIDKTQPTVSSIVLTDPVSTSASTVHFTVNFSENVTGVDESTFSNFVLVPTGGITGAAITSITGTGGSYVVTANTGSGNGNGTLALQIPITGAGVIADAAGNSLGGLPVTSSPYTVSHNPNQKAAIRLQLSFDDANHDLDPSDPANWIPTGTPLDPSNPSNKLFMLDVFVQDTRAAGIATGILAAYLNATYDSSLVSVNGPIMYGMNDLGTPHHTGGSNFTTFESQTLTPGLIGEAGATTDSASQPTNPTGEELLFSIPMIANNIGLATFTPSAALDLPAHDVFEYLGDGQPIPANQINFQPTQIFIGSNVFSLTGPSPSARRM